MVSINQFVVFEKYFHLQTVLVVTSYYKHIQLHFLFIEGSWYQINKTNNNIQHMIDFFKTFNFNFLSKWLHYKRCQVHQMFVVGKIFNFSNEIIRVSLFYTTYNNSQCLVNKSSYYNEMKYTFFSVLTKAAFMFEYVFPCIV